jgi:FMS-like tyrosine kinase 1
MLKSEEEPYLKPINVHERRAEFARQRQAMQNQAVERPIDRDSGYCNAPRNVHLIDLIDVNEKVEVEVDKTDLGKKDLAPAIITQDNYVNMPKQKNDLRSIPNGFSNPSYVVVSNQDEEQKV